MTRRSIVIASRSSPLALWQAEHVRDRLRALHPHCAVSIVPMSTTGDRILDRSLAAIGGKGLFVKELESAIERGEAQLAVHSVKDVPMELPPGFVLAAITAREDPRDAFVSNTCAGVAQLPPGARVGTSSLRREAQLRARFPHLEVRPVRGNVHTRLRKLDDGEVDALILAAAGLKRLGLQDRIRELLPLEASLPAPGQGALGIECLGSEHDVLELVAPLADPDTTAAVVAERALSGLLGGSCQVPLAAYAERDNDALRLRALIALRDGTGLLRAEARGPLHAPQALGERVATELRAQGADAVLAALAAAT